VNGTIDKEKVG